MAAGLAMISKPIGIGRVRERRRVQRPVSAWQAIRGAFVRLADLRPGRRRRKSELRELPDWLRKDIGLSEEFGQPEIRNWWDPPRG